MEIMTQRSLTKNNDHNLTRHSIRFTVANKMTLNRYRYAHSFTQKEQKSEEK